MAITHNALRFLLLARAGGVSFARTTMLGRLGLHVEERELVETFAGFGETLTLAEAKRLRTAESGFAEPLLRHLGAERVESVDASDFEGATITFDLNEPLPDRLRRSASTVLDFGTLEHVFNVTQALANGMEMVEEHGHLLCFSPANNAFGHGFYQFSPEFYFRALTPENGFQVQRLFLCTREQQNPWHEVRDPVQTGRRASAPVAAGPLMILVIAQRVGAQTAFARTPQQSGYQAAWQRQSSLPARLLRRHAPPAVKTMIRSVITAGSRTAPRSTASAEVLPEALARDSAAS